MSVKSNRNRPKPKGFRPFSFNGIDYGWRVVAREPRYDGYAAAANQYLNIILIRVKPRGKIAVKITIFTDMEELVKPSDIRGILDVMQDSGYDPCDGLIPTAVYKFQQSVLRNRNEFFVEEIMSS